METATETPESMMTTDREPEKHSMTMDGESEIEAPWSEIHSGESEDSEEEFDPAIVSDNPTRHGEYDYLKLLGEVNHLASGGSASTGWLDSSTLARFRSPMKNTLLHLAALHGNDEMVDRVATQYPHLLFTFNKNHDTPLHVAARAGHISTLRKLLDACADPNVTRLLELMEMKNKQGNIMLHEAMMCGGNMASMIFHALEAFNTTVEAILMENDADDKLGSWPRSCYELALNNINNVDQSVLYLAVEARLTETVNQILEKCPESATPKGISPLVAAIMMQDEHMLTIILTKKQEWIHLGDVNGRLPLHCAASTGYHEGVVYLLDKCKSCSIQRDKCGLLPLHLAARGGHVEVVKELLGYCPNPNEMLDPNLRNILHIAAKSGKLDVVRYILQTPTLEKMINQKDVFGNTPLHVATFCCCPMIVYSLTWDDRVNLNMVNLEDKTALDISTIEYLKNPSSLGVLLVLIALTSAGAKSSPSSSFKTVPDSEQKEKNEKTAPAISKEVFEEQVQKIGSSTVDSLSVISALIVTASVAACLAVPGEAQGTANNVHKPMFHFFIFCITISFFSSLCATVILIWARSMGSMALSNFAVKLALPFIGAALITLSLAFLGGVYTVISKLTWLATTFLVLTAFFVVILCVLCIIVYLPMPSTRKISRYISYYPFILHAWLAEGGK